MFLFPLPCWGGGAHRDKASERRAWNSLLKRAGSVGAVFELTALEGLPEPAQRFFRYTIVPGTPLVFVVDIEMGGQLNLGTRDKPGIVPMAASQILAPPLGLVWKVHAGRISGSDVATPEFSWTRFWLFNLIPVVRVTGGADHHRSAFGRVVSEGAFWVPASLLPGGAVTWTPVSDNTARATVSRGTFSQAIDLTVEASGQPSQIVIQRWSNENTDKVFREQPFGGYLSDFREINGYRLPMQVEGGNMIGTQDYFPFYFARKSGPFAFLNQRSCRIRRHLPDREQTMTTGISEFGFRCGLMAAAATIAFVIVQILQLAGAVPFPVDEVLIYGTSLVIVVPFLLEMLAFHYLTDPDKRFWTHGALLLTTLYAVFVTANYVVQLATVIPQKLAGTSEAIQILDQTPHSMFWNFDAIGYISMGLATLIAIPALSNRGFERWVRISFLAHGLTTPLIAIVYFYPTYSIALLALGFPWAVTAPLFMILLAITLRRRQ